MSLSYQKSIWDPSVPSPRAGVPEAAGTLTFPERCAMVCCWPLRDPVYTLWRLLAQRRQGQKICLARHPRVSAVGRAKPAP